MPIVQINLIEGRSPDQITALIENVTEAVARSVDSEPSTVRVLVNEVPATHWSVGGRSMKEIRGL
jgi:4-oxalocrotonate tautomerase